MANMTISQTANLQVQKWMPGFDLLPNEEMVLGYEVLDASAAMTPGGANQWNLRRIDIATTQILGTTDDGATITYNTFTDYVTPVTPVFDYSAVLVPLNTLANIDNQGALTSAYKQQLVASLATTMDVALATEVANSIAGQTVGGAGEAVLSNALFLNGWSKLVQSAKEKFKPGVNRATLVVYNKRAQDIVNIPNFTFSYIRGDGTGPLVKGWVNDAMNIKILESGNIYASGGIAHNVLLMPPGLAKAYNMKPTLLDPQPYNAAMKFIACQSRGAKKYFDQYMVDIQTSSS